MRQVLIEEHRENPYNKIEYFDVYLDRDTKIPFWKIRTDAKLEVGKVYDFRAVFTDVYLVLKEEENGIYYITNYSDNEFRKSNINHNLYYICDSKKDFGIDFIQIMKERNENV